MDKSKLILLIHTVKHLKLKQIYYQLFYKIRNKLFKKEYTKPLVKKVENLKWKDSFDYPNSFENNNTFIFLNQSHLFENEIDWNFSEYGKLWTYNLNYFDFLNQQKITKEQGLIFIKDYIDKDESLKDGKEPYPISLRGINWIKFLSRYHISETNIDQTLYDHYQILIHNLEYHLLGNHLLENGYSLLFGGYYFKDEILYQKGRKILIEELDEQILEDGAHFELSPMYHQILLHRLLDCINLVNSNNWKEDDLLPFLKKKTIKMLSWLRAVTFNNGTIPMVNDSTYDIAPNSQELFRYAKDNGLPLEKTKLKDSGYRMFRNEKYELFIDVGNIGPTYQPGHAHADTFNFELYVHNQPFIVDTGISTYEKNKLRLTQRQTASHNTVRIADIEQSQVWDGFRVAKRAKIVKIDEAQNYVEATHNGYKKLHILHTRRFSFTNTSVHVKDTISKPTEKEQIAFFHFHPSVNKLEIFENKIHFSKESIDLYLEGEIIKISEEAYEYAMGFNKTAKGKKLAVYFKNNLSAQIRL